MGSLLDPISGTDQDLEDMLNGIELLKTLGGLTQAEGAIAKASELLGGTLDSRRVVLETAENTAFILAKKGSNALICCHGTDLDSQYVPEFTGFIQLLEPDSSPFIRYPKSKWVVRAGEIVRAVANEIRLWEVRHLWVFGHSAGAGQGGEALSVALGLLNISPETHIRFLTVGGNGWANRTIYDQFVFRVHTVRYMNSEDPVPMFPWCIADMVTGAYALDPNAFRAIRNYVHLGSGRNLDRDGVQTYTTLPVNARADPTLSVVAWLRAMSTGINNEHSTSEYRRRLNLLKASRVVVPRPPDQPRVPVDAGASAPLNLPVVSTRAEAVAALPAVQEAAAERSDNAPRALPTVLPNLNYRARKISGAWAVVRGPVVVFVASGKRQAKGTARRLNRIERDTASLAGGTLADQTAFLQS